jgi:microcystin-dependent protein
MTALPALSYMSNAARTQGEMKTAFDDIIAFMRERFGAGAGWTSIASGSTVNLGGETSRLNLITGTTTITSFGTTNPGDSVLYVVRFASVLTLTHGSNLICPGSANITTAAGDVMLVVWEGSNVWRVLFYQRADGTPLAGGAIPGEIKDFAFNRVPSGWLECDGTAVNRSTYAALFAALVRSSTVTITIATPGVVSWTAHGLRAGDPVKFSTTGALPTGITGGTTYYVIATGLTADSFRFATSAGGSAINTTGSQSGTHTAVNAPYGDGNGSTTFNLPNFQGEFRRGNDNGRGVDTNRSFGSAQSEMIGPHAHAQIHGNSGTVAGGLTGAVLSDGNNGTATNIQNNSGTENRPRNVSVLTCIKT